MTTDLDELKNVIEAALFSAGEPLTIKRMQAMFPEAEPSREDLEQTLTKLETDYASRGIELARIGNAYRFRTRAGYASWLRRLAQTRAPRYSRALLETLSIIAYRQPVTRGDIEDIRGVGVSTEITRTLLDREWIKEVGTRDTPGRPALFGTTRSFLEYFSLESLRDLPPLQDERDIGEIALELNLELPDAASSHGEDNVDEPADHSVPGDAELDAVELAPESPEGEDRGVIDSGVAVIHSDALAALSESTADEPGTGTAADIDAGVAMPQDDEGRR